MNVKQFTAAIAVVAATAAAFQTYAGEPLKSDELKKLIVGNTITVEVVGKGVSYRNYFDPSGKVIRNQAGTISEGSFTIKADGTHCVTFEHENCDKVVSNNDGTYTRAGANGTQVKWVKVAGGKAVN